VLGQEAARDKRNELIPALLDDRGVATHRIDSDKRPVEPAILRQTLIAPAKRPWRTQHGDRPIGPGADARPCPGQTKGEARSAPEKNEPETPSKSAARNPARLLAALDIKPC